MRRVILAVLLASSAVLAEDPPAKPSDAEAKAKVDALKAALKSETDEPKKEAIAACGECPHPACASALAPQLGAEKDDIRIAAAQALGKMKGLAEAAKALQAGAKSNEPKPAVIDAIFTALGEVNHPASVGFCKEWAMDRIAQRDAEEKPSLLSAIRCLGNLKWKTSVSALIDIQHRNEVAGGVRGGGGKRKSRRQSERECIAALSQLTGESFEMSDEWDDWWKKNAAKFNDDMTTK